MTDLALHAPTRPSFVDMASLSNWVNRRRARWIPWCSPWRKCLDVFMSKVVDIVTILILLGPGKRLGMSDC